VELVCKSPSFRVRRVGTWQILVQNAALLPVVLNAINEGNFTGVAWEPHKRLAV